ncbi:unnamed protein product, partial [Cladocopium goreaui]
MRQHEHVCSNLFASRVQTNQAKPSCSHRNSELSLFRAGEVGICSGVIGSVLMLTMDLKKFAARMLFMCALWKQAWQMTPHDVSLAWCRAD